MRNYNIKSSVWKCCCRQTGISDCLVLLEEQQANIIADGAALEQQYEKIFDSVQRNTDYLPEQIVIVPLTNHMTMA